MSASSFVVAIDGPAASGKGTLARRLAAHFGLAHLDTGRLYRATARLVLADGADPDDARAAERAARRVEAGLLADPQLDGETVGAVASVVAAIPAVRRALLDFQRDFAAHPPPPARGAVLDGRDIGSVVCPTADLKLFVTAAIAARARRRVEELRQAGAPAIYANVLQDLIKRDQRDRERAIAPLAAPADAIIIDTTALDADTVFDRAAALVAPRIEEKKWQL